MVGREYLEACWKIYVDGVVFVHVRWVFGCIVSGYPKYGNFFFGLCDSPFLLFLFLLPWLLRRPSH